VHCEARRHGLAGVPKAQLPRLMAVLKERGNLFLPILVVPAGLIRGYSAPLCPLVAALSCLPVAMLRKSTRAQIRWRSIPEALEEGARLPASVSSAWLQACTAGSSAAPGCGSGHCCWWRRCC
jgi:TRAP-type uncharacterized transport system fused permease subunit